MGDLSREFERVMWAVGDLDEAEFQPVWDALGVVVYALQRKERRDFDARLAARGAIRSIVPAEPRRAAGEG